MEQKHAACVERCLYDIYTEIPCLEMSGSNDGCSEPGMFSDLVFREACRSDSKQELFQERNGSTTRL